jgi:hypothetical protein
VLCVGSDTYVLRYTRAANPGANLGCIHKKPRCCWLQVATLTAERDSMASQNMTLASTTSKLMAATAGDSSPRYIHDPAAVGSNDAGSNATLGSSAAVAALNASASTSRSSGHGHAGGSVAVDGTRSDATAARGGAVLTAAQVC